MSLPLHGSLPRPCPKPRRLAKENGFFPLLLVVAKPAIIDNLLTREWTLLAMLLTLTTTHAARHGPGLSCCTRTRLAARVSRSASGRPMYSTRKLPRIAAPPPCCWTWTLWRWSGAGAAFPSTALAQYVNDRPYVASSLMSVAIAQVLGPALDGRSKERPELAGTPIPLCRHARSAALPGRRESVLRGLPAARLRDRGRPLSARRAIR